MAQRKSFLSSLPDGVRSILTKGFPIVQIVLTVAACLFVGKELGEITTGYKWQWDFTTYYYAARTDAAGHNPYDTNAVSAIAGMRVREPFLYPPVSLYLLKPLATPSYTFSYYLFPILKLLALCGLVFFWRRIFPEETGNERGWIFIISLCLAYRYAILWDMKVGNISIFEQFFLWSGIYLFTRGKSAVGAVSIVVGSIFKFLLTAFVPLLLLLRRSASNLMICIAAALLFIALHFLSWLADPVLFRHYLDYVHVRDEVGTHNPSSLAFFKTAVRWFGAPDSASFLFYGQFVAAVLTCSVFIVRKIQRSRTLADRQRQTALISLYVIAFTLVAPRMKDYSYIIMVMPTLFVIRTAFRQPWLRGILYVVLWIPFGGYHPFLLSLAMLLGMIWWVVWKEREDAPDAVPSMDSVPETKDLRERS